MKIPQGVTEALAAMSPDQFAAFVGEVRQDVTVINTAPVSEAISAAKEALAAIDLGDARGAVEALVSVADDEIARTLNLVHSRVVASDLADAVKEQVSGALATVGQRFNVSLPTFAAPAPAVEPEVIPEPEPEAPTQEQAEVAKLQTQVAALGTLAGLDASVRDKVSAAVLPLVESGEIATPAAAREAIEAKAAEAVRAVESEQGGRVGRLLGMQASRDAAQRVTEDEEKATAHPSLDRFYDRRGI